MKNDWHRASLGLLLLAGAIAAGPVRAEEGPTVNLDTTAIRGNQELPKVLYIVPWKDPALVGLAGRPVNSLVEEVLSPVDREVFRRQGRYWQQLNGSQGQAQSQMQVPARD
jgi:hypothetical protein